MQRHAGPGLAIAFGLALAFALPLGPAACGGKVDVSLDGAADDAPAGDDAGDGDATPDGPLDADVDAPPPAPFAGSFSIVEAETIIAGLPGPVGQGLETTFVFTDTTMLPAPTMEEHAGPTGCKVWESTPAEATAGRVGLDEGSITLQFVGGSNPATPPLVPRCSFVADTGYRCSDFTTGSSGGVIALGGGAGNATLTDSDIGYTAANSLGRYLEISGAANPANDGFFPIVAASGNTVTYVNPSAIAELLPGAATHINYAGLGPIPGITDPGFLADDVALTFTHVAGGANHVPAFTLQSTGPGHIGDDFTLDQASLARLTHVPRDGQEMIFACATNCDAENADVSVLDFLTTDAPVTGLPPTVMPPPTARQVELRCTEPGTGTITVPAAYAAKLMTPGVTRVRASFARGAVLAWPDPPVTGIAGHAIVSFTTF